MVPVTIFMPQHTGIFILWKVNGHDHKPHQANDRQILMAAPQSRAQNSSLVPLNHNTMCSKAFEQEAWTEACLEQKKRGKDPVAVEGSSS